MTIATKYKVIETALCIGESVFDGEEVVVLAAEYERLEQECERLRAAPCDCGAPVGYVSGDKFQAEHEHLRECRVQRDAALKQVEGLREALTSLRSDFWLSCEDLPGEFEARASVGLADAALQEASQ